VGWDQEGVGRGLEDDLEEVPRIDPQDGAAVGLDVADGGQPRGDAGGALEVGREDQVVDLADPVAPLIDAADLDLQQEADRAPAGARDRLVHRPGQVGRQGEQARLGRHQLLAQLGEPARVGEVTGAQHPHALQLGEAVQVLEVQLLRGCPRQVGVDVQVGHEPHRRAA
jgi:hypothetical protein